MFRWDFAKSAEAMLSRWAIKRICRFILKKKKLGDYIDLDQLDVQLAEGVIQLRDLALNVDFINEKLGDAPVYVKEGTILSLSFKLPWKMRNCQIEIEDLELVIAPCSDKGISNDKDDRALTEKEKEKEKERQMNASEKLERGVSSGSLSFASLDVHEGVKTIAKIVKWFLTSFNVVIRNFIVAFDPCIECDDDFSHRTLVLRIDEIEYGTRVSEELNIQLNSLLGISKLTNFIKFHGAVIEFLKMDETCASESMNSDNSSKGLISGSTSPVLHGPAGGFSGILNMSIPWKNGSLDISKVDADISLDPLELWLQPSTVKWLTTSWESLKKIDKVEINYSSQRKTESLGKVHEDIKSKTSSRGDFSCTDPQMNQGSGLCHSSSPTYIIQNWVTSDNVQGPAELECDYGLSIDQFFECFDEVRSSQANLGNSGIWNWTCSVFSAITAASSLASESVYLPCEQYSETNLKAKVSMLSIIVSFDDELSYSDHMTMHRHRQAEEPHETTTYDALPTSLFSPVHHLEIKCSDINLALQIFQEFTEVEATIMHIQIADTVVVGHEAERFFSMVSTLQAGVEGKLPAQSHDENFLGNQSKIVSEGSVNIPLLQSSGVFCFKCSLSSTGQKNKLLGLSSFSLYLPLFIIWVDFSLVNMLLALIGQVQKSSKAVETKGSIVDGFDQEHGTRKQSISPDGNLRGDIFLSRTRIVLCFPFDNLGDITRPFCWSSFIVLDFSSLSRSPTIGQVQMEGYLKGRSSSSSTLLHLHSGSLDTYLITTSGNVASDSHACGLSPPEFDSKMILSTTGRTDGRNPGIIMIWQDGPVTGPWLARRAWDLAVSHDPRNKRTVTGRGDEFSSVKRSEDQRETSAQVRQEMILSSSFLMHIYLSQVWIDLSSDEYKMLYRLLNEVMRSLSSLQFDDGLRKEQSIKTGDHGPQASLLLECDVVEIRIGTDEVLEINNSLLKELAGSWNSLRLGVQKFELLSVSNVGGIKSDNFLWLSHSQGDLWGSMTNEDSGPSKNFLLITCKDSAMKRGDGEGGNILCSGSTGTSIIHVTNQELSQSITSIDIRCTTIIAPGGRLDWFTAMSTFFCVSPPHEEMITPDGTETSKQLFFLDLVDIALCYEPHTTIVGSTEKKLSCLLAAASLSLYDLATRNDSGRDYNIRLQDVGLLISEQSRPENETDGYGVSYLRRSNYVKVAQEALVNAVLRTNCLNGLLWELELSDSHICVSTCFDTTSGLARLAGQLQQLFAPDVEDALVHLQSRWDSFKKTSNENGGGCAVKLSKSMNDEDDDDKSAFKGIMDDVLDDAFCSSDIPSNALLMQSARYKLDINSPAGEFSLNGEENAGLPQLIESYYLPKLLPFASPSVSGSSDEPHTGQVKISANRDADLAKGRWFKETPLMIVEDHISDGTNNVGWKQSRLENKLLLLENTPETCVARGRVLVKNVNLVWRMYAGSDWPKKAKYSQPGSVSDENGRDKNVSLELALSGINLHYVFYPDGELVVSKISLSIKDFNLDDKSMNAPWKMVLGYYTSRNHPRESSAKAFRLELLSVKPDPSTPLEEYRVQLSFLPMRLHLHQGQLDFLISFFATDSSSSGLGSSSYSNVGMPQESISQNLPEEALLPFFQKFDIYGAVVRVDYIPHRVDMAALRAGNYVELINLVPWKGIDIKLKPVHAVGVYGWGSICETVIGEWLEDISQNQIHKVLKGLTPVRSLFSVSSGAAKLVSLPVKAYRKDHRLLKGIQRGALAFIRSVSLEAIGLGVHLAGGAHELLLQTESILSGSQPLTSSSRDNGNASVRCNQPNNSQHGIQQAFESLSDGFGKTTTALVGTPLKAYQRGAGTGSALASAIRAAPVVAVTPASAVARAMHCTLLGVRNSLDPEHKKESMEKYLGSSKSREQ